MPFAETHMDLEGIMLSEISQTENGKYCMSLVTCMWNLKYDTNKPICERDPESWTILSILPSLLFLKGTQQARVHKDAQNFCTYLFFSLSWNQRNQRKSFLSLDVHDWLHSSLCANVVSPERISLTSPPLFSSPLSTLLLQHQGF